jgi:spore maturation protein CgeB
LSADEAESIAHGLPDAYSMLNDYARTLEGKELIVYENAQDCLVKLRYYLGHQDEGIEIAKAGHARTMKDHTYLKRMEFVKKKLEEKL